MINEFEDKGKIFTNIVSKSQVPVQIQTRTNLIKGTMHIGLDDRLKDELNKSEMFIAITDASVFDMKGDLVHHCKFLAVNLTQVVWIFQDEARENTGDNNDKHARQ